MRGRTVIFNGDFYIAYKRLDMYWIPRLRCLVGKKKLEVVTALEEDYIRNK